LHCFATYGLHICSEIPLPELQPVEPGKADVYIIYRKLDWFPPAVDEAGTSFSFSPTEAYLHWDHVGTFLVRDGTQIIIDPLPDVEEQLIRLPLLGVVLAVLLHQRGHLVLHASAVALGDQAVIFLGAKGQGKSTIAAALYGQGHPLVADDLIALDLHNPLTPVVYPGFPQLKLWPEAAAASLGDDPGSLPRLNPEVDKRIRRLHGQEYIGPLPLNSICVLTDGPEVALKPLSPQQRVVQFITHSYITRFGDQLLRGSRGAVHLQQCAWLANAVPAHSLERPRSLDLLPRTVRLLESQSLSKHIAGIADSVTIDT
jgi:hypothetical protein